MCGTGSIEVVVGVGVGFGVVSGKEGAKVLFMVDEFGEIGTSHSEIRAVGKISSTRRYVNLNYADGHFEYENGIPSWYAKYQKSIEKTVAQTIKVAIPAYVKKLAHAQVAHDKAIAAAIVKADKALALAKKSAFAPVAKLGGLQS